MHHALLVGCGNDRRRKLYFDGETFHRCTEWPGNLTTLDMDSSCNPDVVWDLNLFPFPFADNSFDEIHAYEVLEHCGTQGDWRFFFNQFSAFWRILKPNGMFYLSSPKWDRQWAWGDPGHTRIIGPEQLTYLSQAEYAKQVGHNTMTDYRAFYKADFKLIAGYDLETSLGVAMCAIKT